MRGLIKIVWPGLTMSGQKRSLADGISSMAQVGALFAGEVAGVEVNTVPW